MIQLTDINGLPVYVAAHALAMVRSTEQVLDKTGLRSYVETLSGTKVAVREPAADIVVWVGRALGAKS